MNDHDCSFNEKCYALLKLVPKGKITTYKAIANALRTKAYRAVGNAMATNRRPVVIPCHRVVKSNGEVGCYAWGTDRKIDLLQKEGIVIQNGKVKDLDTVLYRFSVREKYLD